MATRSHSSQPLPSSTRYVTGVWLILPPIQTWFRPRILLFMHSTALVLWLMCWTVKMSRRCQGKRSRPDFIACQGKSHESNLIYLLIVSHSHNGERDWFCWHLGLCAGIGFSDLIEDIMQFLYRFKEFGGSSLIELMITEFSLYPIRCMFIRLNYNIKPSF